MPRTFKARPTTDFAKENLFNVLSNYIDFEEGIVALDLFAGDVHFSFRRIVGNVRPNGTDFLERRSAQKIPVVAHDAARSSKQS